MQAFAALVVIDVFLQTLVILMEFAALWKFRRTLPDVPRTKVPGGTLGLILVTLGPTAIILLAIYSQIVGGGLELAGSGADRDRRSARCSTSRSARFIKPGKPDIDPFEPEIA